jgi:PAS domain S-box-containing protein
VSLRFTLIVAWPKWNLYGFWAGFKGIHDVEIFLFDLSLCCILACGRAFEPMDTETFPDLSPRESQLLLLASEGLTDNGISQKLGISVATVNSYWVRIRSKLGAQSRTEAVAMALRSQAETSLRKLQNENERLAQELADSAPATQEGTLDSSVFRDLLQAAADGVLIVGRSGKILACNPSLAELFGYMPDDLVGQLVSKLVPDRFRESHMDYIDEYFGAPARRRMGHGLFTPGLKKDGKEIAVAITLGAHEKAGSSYTMCMVRDATPEMEALRKYAPDTPEMRAFELAN